LEFYHQYLSEIGVGLLAYSKEVGPIFNVFYREVGYKVLRKKTIKKDLKCKF